MRSLMVNIDKKKSVNNSKVKKVKKIEGKDTKGYRAGESMHKTRSRQIKTIKFTMSLYRVSRK